MIDKMLFLSSFLIIALLNIAIYQKEKILKEGDIVLFSIISSVTDIHNRTLKFDYQLRETLETKGAAPNIHGYVVIRVDENQMASFSRFFTKNDLKNNEKLIKYHYIPTNEYEYEPKYKITPHQIYLSPTSQKDYKKAKYAVFQYLGTKNYLFIGLVDENYHFIQ